MSGRVNPDTIDLVERLSRYYGHRSPCERDDLAQACWVDLLRYSDSPSFLTARNAILHQCRAARRWRRHDELKPRLYEHGLPDERLDVPELLNHLAPRERQVIELFYWRDLTLKEIGAELDIEWTTVAVTKNNALKKLRKAYA